MVQGSSWLHANAELAKETAEEVKTNLDKKIYKPLEWYPNEKLSYHVKTCEKIFILMNLKVFWFNWFLICYVSISLFIKF